ncbi:MAG: hypothetical protein BWY71_02037 [Planctomycetes bacterium ADurb.Bin412]|nr:MAG: hypothetical protein BWY71_02037 [Planctomycetes bacterium ADurb.Bin412]
MNLDPLASFHSFQDIRAVIDRRYRLVFARLRGHRRLCRFNRLYFRGHFFCVHRKNFHRNFFGDHRNFNRFGWYRIRNHFWLRKLRRFIHFQFTLHGLDFHFNRFGFRYRLRDFRFHFGRYVHGFFCNRSSFFGYYLLLYLLARCHNLRPLLFDFG